MASAAQAQLLSPALKHLVSVISVAFRSHCLKLFWVGRACLLCWTMILMGCSWLRWSVGLLGGKRGGGSLALPHGQPSSARLTRQCVGRPSSLPKELGGKLSWRISFMKG